ncbi:probable cytochrome P450 9f2 [Anopheles marshallii]|uniref:probable cytochrome P450 9f2 n=1 Tax=Anopheles marshallii TaxID=1521116 RepID=UPI00237B7D71|nr:probable cytochrome P450 9f2 [Anopheles marshallii]
MEIDLMVLVPLVAILATIYYYITKDNKYFHDKPIPSMATEPLFGSTRRLVMKQTSFHDFIIEIYNKYPLVKVFGMLDTMQRVFVVRDPELIKRIGVKDFDYFANHRPAFGNNENSHNTALFSKTLVALNDQKWRDMRATLSPAFTGSKMRQMFELIVECSTNMVKYYKEEIHKSGVKSREHEMKDVFTRFANDVIATCAFGIKVDSLKNADNDFYVNGKKMLAFNRPYAMIKLIGLRLVPKLMNWLDLDLFDREQRNYFTEIIRDTLKTREAHAIVRPDMVNLLMQARKGALKQQREVEERNEVKGFATVEEADMEQTSKSLQMTELEMVVQCLIFFLAGFDTVSTCLTFLAYELSINKDVQDKLYEEIRATSKSLDGKSLTYDALQGMQYMDMVVSEALRMWSPAPSTDRLCVRDYVVDDGDRLKFTIDKGTAIFIPIAGLHHDPQYYPNPSKFDPERFSEENRDKIDPNAYLPFGIGPRNCIGSRFALMEVKAIIYYMLQEFSFEPTPNTQIPLRLEKGLANICGMHSEKGVFLEFRPRNNDIGVSI